VLSTAIAGPGHSPTSPQPSPYSAATADQAPIRIATRRQLEGGREQRVAAAAGEREGRRRDRQRAAHHQCQRRIPRTGHVQKVQHLGRVHHPRQREPGAEQHASE
jgi:hypothetical protein